MSSSSVMKDLGNGLALCTVCESQLKVKTLTAHVNGRKHREAVARFRQNAERLKAIAISAQKRPANAPDKEELERSGDQFGNEASKKVKLMANHYTEEDEQQFKTPWQMEAEQSAVDQPPPTASSILAAKPATESVIEGLPYGFFDDKIINSKVREAVEKQKQMDTELNLFFREVADIDAREEEREDEKAETSAVVHDLEELDEQLQGWRAVNELEIRREEVERALRGRQSQPPNHQWPVPVILGPTVRIEKVSEEESDEDEDFNLDELDWRSRML